MIGRIKALGRAVWARLRPGGPPPMPFPPGATREETFSAIYRKKLWGSPESASGRGSSLDGTADIRATLPALCTELGISTLVDVPCGDCFWIASLDLPVASYVGGDIVPDLIEDDRRRLGGEGRSFVVLDLVSDPLPDGDLLLLRDCLVHLSNEDGARALGNVRASRIRYLLATHYPSVAVNAPCDTGRWRAVNLTLPPFDLPAPDRVLADTDFPGETLAEDKRLGLWDLDRWRRSGPEPS